MPRPSEVPGKPATRNLNTKVNDDMMRFVDSARGDRSRGRYVRDLIRAAAANQKGTKL